MKNGFKVLCAFVLLLFSFTTAQAQKGIFEIFCEDFDSTVWKMDTSFSPNPGAVNHFYRDSNLTFNGSKYSAADTARNGVISYLTSPNISVSGYRFVRFKFEHICYLDQSDDGLVEYSFDNGLNWFRMPAFSYSGNGVYDFLGGDLKFNKLSYGLDWRFIDSTYIWTPLNAQWKTEFFDLTGVITAQSTAPDSVKIRFGLADDPATPGRFGTHIWYLDNFCVEASNCELDPPFINLLDPPTNYPQYYEGRVYSNGPYVFDAQVVDPSTIDTAFIACILLRDTNANGVYDTLDIDTLPFDNIGGFNHRGEIPRFLKGKWTPSKIDTIRRQDSVYWKIIAQDATDCRNTSQEPFAGYAKFMVERNLPRFCKTQPAYQYPYYEDFNGSNFFPNLNGFLGNNWTNPTGDFHNWWVSALSTNGFSFNGTGNSGPTDDYPGGDTYLYVESTNTNIIGATYKDSTAFLLSPCFDLKPNENQKNLVRFYLNLNTQSQADTINVDLYDPTPTPNASFGKFIENIVPPISGNKGNQWFPVEFIIPDSIVNFTQIRIRATVGSDLGLSDMALDSFKLVKASTNDLALLPFSLTPFSISGDSNVFAYQLQNLGSSTVTNVELSTTICTISKGDTLCPDTLTYNFTDSLKAGEFVTIEDNTSFLYTVPKGDYLVKQLLSYPSDNFSGNNQQSAHSIGIEYINQANLFFFDHFDSDTLWTASVNPDSNRTYNNWGIGNGSEGAFSAPNAWSTELNNDYFGNGDVSALYSPVFNFSTVKKGRMSFMNRRDFATFRTDGVFLEYSLDLGATWNILDNEAEPNRNWYNDSLSTAGFSGIDVFTGRSACVPNLNEGWINSNLTLPDTLNGAKWVIFRFNFFANNDPRPTAYGFSLDDFGLYDIDSIDISPTLVLSPNDQCNLSNQQRVKTVISNAGLSTVNSFDLEYTLRNSTLNSPEIRVQQSINRALSTNDTVHVLSPGLDMLEYGQYELTIITSLSSDSRIENDTLVHSIENIEGCELELILYKGLGNVVRGCDSSVYSFNYFSNGKDYKIVIPYTDSVRGLGNTNFDRDTLENIQFCLRKNAQVNFNLNDQYARIDSFSIKIPGLASDSFIYRGIIGGPNAPSLSFNWNCEPEFSVTPTAFVLDSQKIQLPIAKDYGIALSLQNLGKDSLKSIEVDFSIDNVTIIDSTYRFKPSDYVGQGQYTQLFLGRENLKAGKRELLVILKQPNGRFDGTPEDDSLVFEFSVMDTISLESNGSYCNDFEDPMSKAFIGLNSYNYLQSNDESSFRLGAPFSQHIMTAASGQNAWATQLRGDYLSKDNSSLVTPWFKIIKDSCYAVRFNHQYYISDSLNDGGTFEIGIDSSANIHSEKPQWFALGNALGDTSRTGQSNWFTKKQITSMPPRVIEGNDLGSPPGWTGIRNNWHLATNSFPNYIDSLSAWSEANFLERKDQYVTFRWRFESNDSLESDGWAIDDFCIEKISRAACFSLGIHEVLNKEGEFYLGQNIPNPTNESTIIPYASKRSQQLSLQIRNTLGQTIFKTRETRPAGDGIFEIDVSDWEKGMYYYTLSNGTFQLSKKMVVK